MIQLFSEPTLSSLSFFFFFNDTATTEIYTLSLHDALPISQDRRHPRGPGPRGAARQRATRDRATAEDRRRRAAPRGDRKSTRLNSSHLVISYAVFCLKKKKKNKKDCYQRIHSNIPHMTVRQ